MFRNNELIDNTYQVLKELGVGGAGVVYLAYHVRLLKYVVIKRIKDDVPDALPTRKEVDILKNLHHPNLPQVYDFVEAPSGVYTVIDYVEGTDLATYIREGSEFTEQQLLLWFYQIAQVLDYLHCQSTPIYHCDIKPENIMITPEGNAVLIDFNVSLNVQYAALLGVSPPYASPEQLKIAQEMSSFGYSDEIIDERSDIYSLGATFYHAMTGVRPMPNYVMPPLKEQVLAYSERFCEIVDRAMAYDREERYSSAFKLLGAIERSKSGNRRYKLMFVTRCASILLSATLIGSGIYCLLTGNTQKKQEAYVEKLSSAFSALSKGDTEKAEEQCFEILNGSEYKDFLKKNPQERAQLLHSLGEAEYQNQRFAPAADYYERALNALPKNDRELRSRYLRDAIVAYAESGNLSKAEALIEKAKTRDLENVDMLLIQAVLASQKGQEAECASYAQQVLDQTTDAQLCARAALAAASVASDPDTELMWLKKAQQYRSNKTVLRALAVANVQLAQENRSDSISHEALLQAHDYYVQLTSDAYPTKTDWINYSIVLMMLDRSDDAVIALEKQLSVYPNDYSILMQLAFASYEKGDTLAATSYCRDAIQAWKSDRSPERESLDSENIQNLNSLAQRLGIGGME